MASVNKQSLREEFGTLKDRFGRLCSDGHVTEESRALIEALLMLLQVLMVVFMEKNTPKNSTNSSRPASQTPKDDTAVTQSGTHGKGRVLNETRSGNTRTVESRQISLVGLLLRKCTTSSGLKITGNVWGAFGIGRTSSTSHGLFSVTAYRNRDAAVSTWPLDP